MYRFGYKICLNRYTTKTEKGNFFYNNGINPEGIFQGKEALNGRSSFIFFGSSPRAGL